MKRPATTTRTGVMATSTTAAGTPAPVETTTSQPGVHSFVVSGTRFDVAEHYKLIKPIGHGAYGVVVSANDELNKDKVAIKKVPRAFDDLIDAKRILREIKLLRHFDHENVSSKIQKIRFLTKFYLKKTKPKKNYSNPLFMYSMFFVDHMHQRYFATTVTQCI